MSKPKISIITVCYNSELTIEETIKSVVNQDYDYLEYIIIDGGSNDGTLSTINKYKEKIAVVVTEPDRGISDAFNKGIERATGELIGLINSDDLLAEGALKAIASFYSPEVDVYRGNLIIEDGTSGNRYEACPTMNFSIIKRIGNVCHPSTFITKKAYQKWGNYRVEFRYMMDLDLLYRFYRAGAIFKHVDAELAVFRIGGRTADDWRKKMNEYKELLQVNGCPRWLRIYQVYKFKLYSVLKQWGASSIGMNRLRKLKYGNC